MRAMLTIFMVIYMGLVAYLVFGQKQKSVQYSQAEFDKGLIQACEITVRNTCTRFAECSTTSIQEIQDKLCVLE